MNESRIHQIDTQTDFDWNARKRAKSEREKKKKKCENVFRYTFEFHRCCWLAAIVNLLCVPLSMVILCAMQSNWILLYLTYPISLSLYVSSSVYLRVLYSCHSVSLFLFFALCICVRFQCKYEAFAEWEWHCVQNTNLHFHLHTFTCKHTVNCICWWWILLPRPHTYTHQTHWIHTDTTIRWRNHIRSSPNAHIYIRVFV